MRYVCKSLAWWPNGVLVVVLGLEPSLRWMEGFSSPDTTVPRQGFLTVPILWDAQLWTEPMREDAFELFMQRLMLSLTPLGMELQSTGRIFTALTYLAETVLSSSSMPGLHAFYTVQTTE